MKKKLPLYGVLVALAFVLSYVEALVPFSLGIPGVKLGLANLVTLVALYLLPAPGAAAVALCRIVLAGFTFGSLSSMLYALCGGVLSFLVMWLCKKLPCFSPVGVSVAGGVSHNIGQLACAVFVMQTASLSWYLPVLLLSGTLAGAVIGVLGGLVVRRLPKER
ncbi:MAG: Gx transporter family protein [Clostridia bacterium]|nr:Gx transporter family protein [Clostridia bacterium]